ncbi:hypothetical protein ACG873_03915 [Mesorhizobium sp. AaZ16]|uniref:hypothetical protein n=1 Tax=Mesorhizobium sp. AaZ16 TaxID=3402289 RepID=UPI00374FC251
MTIEGGNTARAAAHGTSGVPGRASLKAVPGDVMKRAHWEKLRLCDALESIADALRTSIASDDSEQPTIVPLIRGIHRFEESVIFPAYQAYFTLTDANLASISRLSAEHFEDQCFRPTR